MNRKIIRTNRVYIKKSQSYEDTDLKEKIRALLDLVLSDASLLPEGKNVLIKPNLLTKRTPDAAVTTNPVYVQTAAEYFLERGAAVTIADSPGGVYNKAVLSGIYKAAGMEKAAQETGAHLNYDTSSQKAYYDGEKTKYFELISPVINADIIVNLARLKTHAMCEMSAAVKNMFGSIPGLQKAEMHARFPRRLDFASLLVDLALCTAPQINIVDAIIAMEGNGPAGGTPKKTGAILASANPFALDMVCAEIMGYKPDEVGTVQMAVKRGVSPKGLSDLDIIPNEINSLKTRFKRPDGYAGGLLKQLPYLFGGRLQKWLEPKPYIDRRKCIGCGKCCESCPKHTISIQNGKASIDLSGCIKCYCCQELCPVKAVNIKKNKILQA